MTTRAYDLVLHGGRVPGPDGAWRRADVGVAGGVIAAVEDRIDPALAPRSADLAGALALPGLVDLHVHAYPGATYWGIDVDEVSLRSGVTTVVDAGSAGPYTFAGLAPRLRAARVRALAFLNVAAGGLAAPHGELLSPAALDVEAAVRVAREHPDLVVGFKLRASPNTVGPNAAAALAAVRRAADETGLKVMVHVSEAPPDLATVLDHLRAGDVLTHCFTPYDNCVVGEDGRPRPEAVAAVERGVVLDVGHGSGSFSFPAAEAWARSGLPPAVISTDLHRRSVLGPAFDMTTVMAKALAAGETLERVLRAVTALPSGVLRGATGRSQPPGVSGALDVGAPADIAVLRLEDRPLRVWDSRGIERVAERRFACLLTVRSGEVAFASPEVRLVGA